MQLLLLLLLLLHVCCGVPGERYVQAQGPAGGTHQAGHVHRLLRSEGAGQGGGWGHEGPGSAGEDVEARGICIQSDRQVQTP